MNRRQRRAAASMVRGGSVDPRFEPTEVNHFHLPDGTVRACDRTDLHQHCMTCGKAYADSEMHDGFQCDCGTVFTAMGQLPAGG